MKNPEIIEIEPINLRTVPQLVKDSEMLLANARKITIMTQAAYLESDVLLKKVKTKISQLETDRRDITGPLDIIKKRIMKLYDTPIDFLKEGEQLIKSLQIVYLQTEDQKRREAEAKLQAQTDKARKEAEIKAAALRQQAEEAFNIGNDKEAGKLLAKAILAETKAETIVAPVLPGVELAAGSSLRTNWYAEVVDFKVLEDAYKLPDQKKLDALARASKGALTLPGVVFKSEQTISSRKETVDVGF